MPSYASAFACDLTKKIFSTHEEALQSEFEWATKTLAAYRNAGALRAALKSSPPDGDVWRALDYLAARRHSISAQRVPAVEATPPAEWAESPPAPPALQEEGDPDVF
jgi:uncharacterized caspase-like protein